MLVSKTLEIVAGPNGSGKSSFAHNSLTKPKLDLNKGTWDGLPEEEKTSVEKSFLERAKLKNGKGK